MAVYTKLAHQEVEQFLDQYNINNFKDYKGITEGVENTNYFINTLEQDYILTIYEKRVDENDLPFFINLLSNLSENKFPCPKPIANKNKDWPRGSPSSYEERLEWLTMHMKEAGFYDALNKPYDRDEFLKINDQMEASCYPKGQQFPDTSTYFGKMAKIIEDQRNQTIYDLTGKGGCCFAGAGHLIELKQQFPKLNTIDLDKISG
jgi:hypothetical protein